LAVNPRDTIGRAIWTTGIYDLAASEALFRLAAPGALHLDIGANIGCMTGLLATRAGLSGQVIAFEPHPVVGERLAENLARFARLPNAAPVEFRAVALGDAAGEAWLIDPDGFGNNTGLARLASANEQGGTVVKVERLDDVLGDRTAVLAKIDVEGHEAAVLRGAPKALTEKRLRHVIFEEHGGPDAESVRLLLRAGYSVFQLGWKMSGPVLAELAAPTVCKKYEAPNYLATCEPERVRAALSRGGWHALTNRPLAAEPGSVS